MDSGQNEQISAPQERIHTHAEALRIQGTDVTSQRSALQEELAKKENEGQTVDKASVSSTLFGSQQEGKEALVQYTSKIDPRDPDKRIPYADKEKQAVATQELYRYQATRLLQHLSQTGEMTDAARELLTKFGISEEAFTQYLTRVEEILKRESDEENYQNRREELLADALRDYKEPKEVVESNATPSSTDQKTESYAKHLAVEAIEQGMKKEGASLSETELTAHAEERYLQLRKELQEYSEIGDSEAVSLLGADMGEQYDRLFGFTKGVYSRQHGVAEGEITQADLQDMRFDVFIQCRMAALDQTKKIEEEIQAMPPQAQQNIAKLRKSLLEKEGYYYGRGADPLIDARITREVKRDYDGFSREVELREYFDEPALLNDLGPQLYDTYNELMALPNSDKNAVLNEVLQRKQKMDIAQNLSARFSTPRVAEQMQFFVKEGDALVNASIEMNKVKPYAESAEVFRYALTPEQEFNQLAQNAFEEKNMARRELDEANKALEGYSESDASKNNEVAMIREKAIQRKMRAEESVKEIETRHRTLDQAKVVRKYMQEHGGELPPLVILSEQGEVIEKTFHSASEFSEYYGRVHATFEQLKVAYDQAKAAFHEKAGSISGTEWAKGLEEILANPDVAELFAYAVQDAKRKNLKSIFSIMMTFIFKQITDEVFGSFDAMSKGKSLAGVGSH